MTEPVITINGRTLVEGQSMAVRVAISDMHLQMCDPDHLGKDADARRMTMAYRDRLDEVIAMIATPTADRSKQERALAGMHDQRIDRMLQLAGIVPEQATEEQRRTASTYAATGIRIDEAAMRLQRALEKP